MKEDSLLSSLSNISYQAHHQHSDFFNESSLGGGYVEVKVNPPKDQEEVNLNFLPPFNSNNADPPSPKNNGLLMASYWTAGCDLGEGNSENGSEMAPEDEKVKNYPQLEQIKPKVQRKNSAKASEAYDNSSDEQVGTVIKNQTKNIPKNYGKAIITYIQKQKQNFQHILKRNGIKYEELLGELTKKKKSINTIANLRELWVDFKHAKCMRILSNQFLRKYALQYIFNSRICNYTSHVKYRKRLQEAIETPNSFRHIKQY